MAIMPPPASPALLTCRLPLHNTIRSLRRGRTVVGMGPEAAADREKGKEDQELEAIAAAKRIPVSHYEKTAFTPPASIPEIKNKYYPFFKPINQRVPAPYAYDHSLDKAQINKHIYPVFPFKKCNTLWDSIREEKRARRRLPVPVSLTGLGLDDGATARYWTVRIRNMIEKLEKEVADVSSQNFADNVTPGVKIMLETADENLTGDHKELLRIYTEEKNRPAPDEPEPGPLVFPHRLTARIRQQLDEEIVLAKQEDQQLLDTEYAEYMKHRRVLSYMSEGMKERGAIDKDEFDSEVSGWRDQFWRRSYGTADPAVPPSRVPCGGCGAVMHCNDPGIPGYLPSEKFTQLTDKEKKREVCQRCEFLQHFNVSIDVNVPPEEYPAIISSIRENKSIVVLMVDLLDFPCSIWPDVVKVFGKNRKIFVVGNKVDLLPSDGRGHLERVVDCLKTSLTYAGVDASQDIHVRNVSLISAKTGFGVERLITRLLHAWNGKEDIYLLGCTNVGKSTLFNALLQSDICAARENDLIQRATTSLWPGTTLNLLKFPIQKLEGWQQQMREERLRYEERVKSEEFQLRQTLYRQTGNVAVPGIIDRIGMTFRQEVPFTTDSTHPFARTSKLPVPFDESDRRFHNSRFFFDTPGTVYRDQLLSQLTTEELLKTVPRNILTPRSFSLQPFQSLFIAGIGRLDVVHSRQNVLLTVFASQYLPIHVVYTQEASRFYRLFLGTELLAVPCGSPERLQHWPPLVPKEIDLQGIDWRTSCADVVLSSAGWIAVTIGQQEECVLKAYTPEGRGIFVRKPALLPFAVNMRGRRVIGTPCFQTRVVSIHDFDEELDPHVKHLEDLRAERSDRNAFKSYKLRKFAGPSNVYGWHDPFENQDTGV